MATASPTRFHTNDESADDPSKTHTLGDYYTPVCPVTFAPLKTAASLHRVQAMTGLLLSLALFWIVWHPNAVFQDAANGSEKSLQSFDNVPVEYTPYKVGALFAPAKTIKRKTLPR